MVGVAAISVVGVYVDTVVGGVIVVDIIDIDIGIMVSVVTGYGCACVI